MPDASDDRDGAEDAAGRTGLGHGPRIADDLIDSLPGVFYVFDVELRFLRWNRAFEEVTGYGRSEFERMSPLDLFAEEERERVAAGIGEAFGSGASGVDADLVAKDGTRTPYHFTGRRSESGGRPVLVGMGIDISQRRRSETERHRLVLDMGERIKELRCLHDVTEAVRSAEDLQEMLARVAAVLPRGLQHPEATRGRVVFDGRSYDSAPFDPTPVRMSSDIVVEGRPRGRAEVFLVGDGDPVAGEPFLEEERELLGSVAAALGEAVARRESEARYRSLFASVPVSIWDEDWTEILAVVRQLRRSGETDFRRYFEEHPDVVRDCLRKVRVRDVNQATLDLFGAHDTEQMLGSLETVFATPDILPGFVGELVALAEGRRLYRTEMALNTVRGDRIAVLLTMAFPPEGDPSGRVLVSVMDISELQRAMAALEESNAELEQFAHVASHDLQEPLRMVASYLQLIERRYAGALDDDGREFIAFAVDGARRMKRMINDLLSFSRIVTRGGELRPADSTEALQAAAGELEATLARSGATLTFSGLPPVLADSDQLRQLFRNLLDNAVKFRRNAPPEIHVGAVAEDDGWWRFDVRDNGIGIEPGYAERVFEIFQRLHASSVYPGSGIGLAICRRIVARHGGRIWFESVPGEGTTFSFTLQAATGL